MRKAFALAVAILAANGLFATGTLRLMSYNVCHCKGFDDRRVDCTRTAAAILKERPDFVGLQEVDVGVKRSGMIDEPVELGRLAGYHATFAKAIDYRGGEYGVAVLSREKPLSVQRIPIPAPEPRILLMCEFTNCWFGTTHLDSRTIRGAPAPSHVMAVPTISNIVVKCGVGGKPVFLTGDWNATPRSEFVARMRRFLSILNDVKHPTNGRQTRCIDYVAVDSANADKVSVKESHVIHECLASDHKPVIVALEIKRHQPSERIRHDAFRRGAQAALQMLTGVFGRR